MYACVCLTSELQFVCFMCFYHLCVATFHWRELTQEQLVNENHMAEGHVQA